MHFIAIAKTMTAVRQLWTSPVNCKCQEVILVRSGNQFGALERTNNDRCWIARLLRKL